MEQPLLFVHTPKPCKPKLPVVVVLDHLIVLLELSQLLLAQLGLVFLHPSVNLPLGVVLVVVLANIFGRVVGFPAATAAASLFLLELAQNVLELGG